MKELILNQSFIPKKFKIRRNSLKVKFFLIHILILALLFIFFISSSSFLINKTAENTLESYGKSILKNYMKTFDVESYLKFLENPVIENPKYDYILQDIKNLKFTINATFVYTIKLNENNNEVMLIDASDEDLYLPPGYILRDKPNKIVRDTYRKKKFIKSTLVSNSWGDYYSFYLPILDSKNNVISLLGVDLDSTSLNNTVAEDRQKVLSFITKFSLILYGFSLIISGLSISKLIKPIVSIKSFLKLISRGNLSEKLNHSENTDEFSSIQNLFIDMTENIKKILRSIISTSKKIDSTFLEVESKKTDIIKKISDINSLTSQITKSNEKIFLNTNNVKDEIFSFNSSINKMSNEIYNIREISQNTQKICTENTENIQSFILEISPLIQKFENFKSNTSLLNELSIEIKQILKEIHDIANQTKLLSLNASIVAASAGEHGDGFTVVAKEIGELSYKTSQSVSHIQDTLATIIKTIFFINSEAITTSNIFEKHAIKSSMFSENLEKINQLILKSSSSLENIAIKSKALTDKNNLILSSIKYIHDESKSNNLTLKSILNSTNKLSELSLSFKIEFKKINLYIKNIRDSYKVFKIKKED